MQHNVTQNKIYQCSSLYEAESQNLILNLYVHQISRNRSHNLQYLKFPRIGDNFINVN